MLIHKSPHCFLFFLTFFLACSASASEYITKIGLNVEHTNNSGLLSKSQAHHDIKVEPSLGIDYRIGSGNFQSNLNYSATRIDYRRIHSLIEAMCLDQVHFYGKFLIEALFGTFPKIEEGSRLIRYLGTTLRIKRIEISFKRVLVCP